MRKFEELSVLARFDAIAAEEARVLFNQSNDETVRITLKAKIDDYIRSVNETAKNDAVSAFITSYLSNPVDTWKTYLNSPTYTGKQAKESAKDGLQFTNKFFHLHFSALESGYKLAMSTEKDDKGKPRPNSAASLLSNNYIFGLVSIYNGNTACNVAKELSASANARLNSAYVKEALAGLGKDCDCFNKQTISDMAAQLDYIIHHLFPDGILPEKAHACKKHVRWLNGFNKSTAKIDKDTGKVRLLVKGLNDAKALDYIVILAAALYEGQDIETVFKSAVLEDESKESKKTAKMLDKLLTTAIKTENGYIVNAKLHTEVINRLEKEGIKLAK